MSTKPARIYSAINESQLQEWRRRGPLQKRMMLLFTVTVFSLGILAMVLLSVNTALPAPLPQAGGQGGYHRGARGQSVNQELARLSKRLSLTTDQKAKIKPILEDEHKQMAALRKNSSLSRQDMRSQFVSIRAKTFDQIRPLLSNTQQTTLKQMQEQQEQRMKSWQERHNNQGSAPANQ
jgi:periplasmic protein CpxP/Spy